MPATVTKYVDEEQCEAAAARKCFPVTRQECEVVQEKVARQTTETKCRTEYKEECTQPRAAGYN